MTFDVRENERKMSVYLSKKIDEIAKATGADIAPPTAPRKGPYDSRVYQTTHVTGGTIMGSDPGNERRLPSSAALGCGKPVCRRCIRLSLQCGLQPDRPARGTRASTRRRPQRLRCAAAPPLIPI